MNSFNRNIVRWAKLHPDDVLSQYFLKEYKESTMMKRAENKKWKLIAKELIDRSQVGQQLRTRQLTVVYSNIWKQEGNDYRSPL
jgi:hypothetical protein